MNIDDRLEKSQRRIQKAVGDLQDLARGVGPGKNLDPMLRDLAAKEIERIAEQAEVAASTVPEIQVAKEGEGKG